MGTASAVDAALLGLRRKAIRRLFPESMILKKIKPHAAWVNNVLLPQLAAMGVTNPVEIQELVAASNQVTAPILSIIAAQQTWIPSREQRLPIDDCLDGLPARMRSSKISSAYIAARCLIIHAVERAGLELETRRVAEKEVGPLLQRRAAAASGFADQIDRFIAKNQDWRVASGFGYRAARMDYTQRNDDAKAAHSALDAIATARDAACKLAELARAERNRLIPPHAPGDVWRQGFVSVLCDGWLSLTESDPTPDGGRFRRFVLSCYDSLEGNSSTASRASTDGLPEFDEWIGVIRTVVKDWKGRQREQHLNSPSAGREVVTETLAERRVRDTEKRNAELVALASVPSARKLFEHLVAGHPEREPRKPRSK